MNLQNNQILCFHPKFRNNANNSSTLVGRKENFDSSRNVGTANHREKLSSEEIEGQNNESGEQERSDGEGRVREISAGDMNTQIGNNELYWEVEMRTF